MESGNCGPLSVTQQWPLQWEQWPQHSGVLVLCPTKLFEPATDAASESIRAILNKIASKLFTRS